MIQNRQQKHIANYVIVWLPTISYCGLIFYFSSLPSMVAPELFPGQDKIFHFFEFGFLSLLFFFSIKKTFLGASLKVLVVITILFTALYGISDEIHQYFVPGRESSIGDALADFSGAIIFQGKKLLKRF